MIESEDKAPVLIPKEALSPEALHGIIESFVLREGTDYGAREVDLDVKKRQVFQQIGSGEIKIIFDPKTESIGLISKIDWNKSS